MSTVGQKKEILHQQDNKCAKCHKKLDPRAIHFHHKKPWSSGGRTITQNGAALCPKCHEILSHRERLKKWIKEKGKNNRAFLICLRLTFHKFTETHAILGKERKTFSALNGQASRRF